MVYFGHGHTAIGSHFCSSYPNISSNDYKYILNHSESILCVVSDQQIYDKVFSVKSQVKELREIYSFDIIEGCKNWMELLESGKKAWNEEKLEEVKSNVESDSIATIIYTSGTTGVPKGSCSVMAICIQCDLRYKKISL